MLLLEINSTSYIRNSLLAKIPTITYTEKLKIHQPIFRDFLFCMLLGLVISCNKSASEDRNHLVFRYNEHANISSLDPAFAKDQRNIWACHQLYNTLIELDESLHIQPSIAHDWEISEDGLSYTFYLRDDVYFHENEVFGDKKTRMLTAHDAVFSLERLRDPTIASSGSWILQPVNEIKAINDTTLQIQLHQAFPPFLGLLSMKYASIVPVEANKSDFDFRKNPIGTGPFHFKRWEENEKLVFRKNPLYFEEDENGVQLPYLEAVAITFLPEKQGEFMEFIQGKIDFLSGLHPSYKDELIDLSGNLLPDYQNRIKMQKSSYLNTEYIGLYLDASNPFLQEKKFRQALNYGINRSLMMKYLRNNVGIPATKGFVPQGLPGAFEEEMYTYQPERATSLINEVKTKLNNPKPKIRIATNASYLDLIEFVQKEWTKLGIEVFIDVMPASTLLQQRSAGKLEAFRGSWIADYPDAENYLTLFTSTNFSPNGPNYTHFSDAEFDQLYKASSIETSSEKRNLIYAKMDSLLMQESPVIPLFYDEVIRFQQNNVHGLGINPLNLLDLRRVKKEPL
jgi:peptide/nickel transport system substrate-binding protein